MSEAVPPEATSRGAANALVELLFDSGTVGVAIVDRELRYLRVNRGLASMNGLEPALHRGRHLRDVLPAAAANVLEPLLRRVLDDGAVLLDQSLSARVPVRGEREFLGSFHPIRDEAGVVTAAAIMVSERTNAELALRELEGRLRRVAGSGIVGLFFWTMDGRIVEANDAFLSMLGYTQDDLAAGRVDWRSMTPPEYAQLDEAAVRELMTTGQHGQIAKEYIGRNGRRVPVVITSAMLDGSTERGVCICLDDTARRAAEARLGRVLAQAPAAVAVLLGPDHVVQSTNKMFVRLFGRRSFIGKPAGESAPEIVEQGFVALLDRVYQTGEPHRAREARLVWDRDGDGTQRAGYFDFVYQPLWDAAGAVEGVLVFAVEVTAQVMARRETERSADRTSRLQSLTAALARTRTVDEVADVIVAEAVAATGAGTGLLVLRRQGATAFDIVRQTGLPDDIMPPWGEVELSGASPAAQCLRTGEPQWAESRDELLRHFPDVSALWERLASHALATVPLVVAGDTIGLMSFTFDAPRALSREDRDFFLALGHQAAQALERARLFSAERDARAEAEAANRAKGEFLAVMSHELRTPLNAIAGYAELMEMGLYGPVTPPQIDALTRVQRSQRHLLGLINEVLNYARLETGSVVYDLAVVSLRDVVADAEGLVAPQAAARGLTMTIEACDATLSACADAEKIRQVLVNLLSNAVKFTDRGGEIGIACAQLGTRVTIAVRDTGIGIASDQLERIFEPFVQVRADLTRPHDGAGLGLAISRDLARGMKGDLVVESEPGTGSTFTLILPSA